MKYRTLKKREKVRNRRDARADYKLWLESKCDVKTYPKFRYHNFAKAHIEIIRSRLIKLQT